jgi:hypothetical protein
MEKGNEAKMNTRMKFKVLWHEPSNFIAVVDPYFGGLPMLHVIDEEFESINPFFSYPLVFLKHYGWIEIGEI